jgi:hypothetical protein
MKKKCAVTSFVPSIVTVHVAVPVQAPLHPVKIHSAFAFANKTTVLPASNEAEHAGSEQETALPLTTPAPAFARWIANGNTGSGLKVAVTARSESRFTWQLPVPVHAPLQPANDEPAAAVAVSDTSASEGKLAEHAGPQSMPTGALTTLPAPTPSLSTSSKKFSGAALNASVRMFPLVEATKDTV